MEIRKLTGERMRGIEVTFEITATARTDYAQALRAIAEHVELAEDPWAVVHAVTFGCHIEDQNKIVALAIFGG